MKEVLATSLKTLQAAKEIGLEAGLNYVYAGNVASIDDSDTKCPQCGSLLIEHSGFGVMQNNIKDGNCPKCGLKIAGVICPTHCTRHIAEIKAFYPEKYVEGGAGKIINL